MNMSFINIENKVVNRLVSNFVKAEKAATSCNRALVNVKSVYR